METPDIMFILDSDRRTTLSEELKGRIEEMARARGRRVATVELIRAATPPCTGCWHCMTKHPGKCAYDRSFRGIASLVRGCPLIVFMAPVRFGTFSSPVKNIIDRGGLIITDHRRCLQVVIGYAEDATDEERSTFIDIIAKHRGKADVVHPMVRESIEVYFTRRREDNHDICERLAAVV
jgi:multimeric flavodoxin WrbA